MSLELRELAAKPASEPGWWTPRLAGPLIAAAVVRMALLVAALARSGTGVLTQGDSISYLNPGRNLLLHGRFFAEGVPDLVRTPGYPLFLGMTSLAGLPAAAVANVILSVLSVFLVWRLGRVVTGDDRIAIGAAWLLTFEPISILFSFVLLSEPLFIMLLLFVLERLTVFLRKHRLSDLALAGISLAAATYVRPLTYYLVWPLALGLFVVLAWIPRLRWKAPAVLLLATVPWLAAWQIRNKVETGFGGFTSVGDVNLYFYNAAMITAQLEHKNYSDFYQSLGWHLFNEYSGMVYLTPAYLKSHPEQIGWNQTQRIAFLHAQSVRILAAHPLLAMKGCVTPMVQTTFYPGVGYVNNLFGLSLPPKVDSRVDFGVVRASLTLLRERPWEAAEKGIFILILAALYLLAVRGFLRMNRKDACIWLLLGISLYLIAVTAAGAGPGGGDARYRLPIIPVLCIFAAAGIWRTKAVA
jgi:4-amino-4-deoxy-L-arabinose transferase-like glycosyltransferase